MAAVYANAPKRDDASSESYSDSESDGACCGGENAAQAGMKGPVATMPPEIRRGFIRKVYSILTAQLAVTCGIATYMHQSTSPAWAAHNMWLYYTCTVVVLAMACCVGCVAQRLRTFPFGYIFLTVFTLAMSGLMGFVCTLYTGESLLITLATTAVVFLGLTAYACFTKTDFTGLGPYLYGALICMMAFGFVLSLVSWFTPIPHNVRLVYAFCGVLLFSMYIVYDTQLIVGGTHKIQFDIDDYVLAALNIYLDILNLFLYLLEFFGERR